MSSVSVAVEDVAAHRAVGVDRAERSDAEGERLAVCERQLVGRCRHVQPADPRASGVRRPGGADDPRGKRQGRQLGRARSQRDVAGVERRRVDGRYLDGRRDALCVRRAGEPNDGGKDSKEQGGDSVEVTD